MYDQECAMCSFNKQNLTNEPYYERFITKVNVGEAIGIIRCHCVLVEDTDKEVNKKYWWT